jgi:hypothetical protein
MSKDVFGSKLGRIHMPRQDYRKLQVKRGRALRTEKSPKKASKLSKKWTVEINKDFDKHDSYVLCMILIILIIRFIRYST